jgi:hypothetical protein
LTRPCKGTWNGWSNSGVKAEQEKRAIEWAELAGKQAAISAGETINLGQGMFATATGEAWRHFCCRQVRVIGVNRDRCYNALPVVASAADTASFLRNSQMTNTSALYMEPGIRMLTAIAVVLPCSAHLAALCQNTVGAWIQATPALLPAAAPKPIDTVETYETEAAPVGDPIGQDFEEGGIYPLEVIREIDDVHSRHKKVACGTNKFADAVQTTFEAGGHNTPDGGKAFWTHALRAGHTGTPHAAGHGEQPLLEGVRRLRGGRHVHRRHVSTLPAALLVLGDCPPMPLPGKRA